jgi:hypothetical protein
MTDKNQPTTEAPRRARVSVDTWAVLLALTLAAIVRLGILPAVKW